MRFASWIVVLATAACGGEAPRPAPVRNVVAPAAQVALPTDAELGQLAIMGRVGDQETWVPDASFPFLVEGTLREGKGPPPSWRAFDSRGGAATLTYGATLNVPYGCDGNQLTVSRLTGDGALAPGLVWLVPATAAWKPRPLAISNRRPAEVARRELAVGDYTIEILRTARAAGQVRVIFLGKVVVHEIKFERAPMDGAPDDPIDLVEGGIGVPVPEAAWELDHGRVLVAFRVPGYEGTNVKAIVVSPERGRAVESMGFYLYECAF